MAILRCDRHDRPRQRRRNNRDLGSDLALDRPLRLLRFVAPASEPATEMDSGSYLRNNHTASMASRCHRESAPARPGLTMVDQQHGLRGGTREFVVRTAPRPLPHERELLAHHLQLEDVQAENLREDGVQLDVRLATSLGDGKEVSHMSSVGLSRYGASRTAPCGKARGRTCSRLWLKQDS